ncbi:MAG: sulfotransferase domain-containing protein [Chloroflexota bacterium]
MTNPKLPNLIIAGVTKAGTTSLFMYLKQHPDICASSVKETCYFLPVRYNTPMEPLSVYQDFFAECGDTKFTMEATPGYYYGGKRVAEAIRETVGDAYVIVVLREPISRMFSFYKYLKSRLMLPKKMTFGEYVRQCEQTPVAQRQGPDGDRFWGIDGGFYDDYLQDWVEVFGEKLRIVLFDDLMNSPTECSKSVCAWLGLDGSLYDGIQLQVENRSVNFRSGTMQKLAVALNDGAEQFWRRFPRLKQTLRDWYYRINGEEFEERIPAEVRQHLNQVFRPHNQRLAEGLTALGYRDLPAWLGGAE